MIGIDWRRALLYTHRWLGIAGSLVFLVWFASGVVMMYERLPRLTGEERLARLKAVDLGVFRVPPGAAAEAAGLAPDRVRLGMLAGRPVYRFVTDGRWTTVYGDTGAPLAPLPPAEALDVAAGFLGVRQDTLVHDRLLATPDQWTINGGLARFLPLHRIHAGDDAGTAVYVSARTGDVVMKTTTRSRVWGYLGAVLHWTYFTPFRLHAGVWRWSVIAAALVGCVLCLSGLVVGVWRLRLSSRFRLRLGPSHSPYAGWLRWHHYAGLVFGVVSFTWALSGALSLTPWDGLPSTRPSAEQRHRVRGGPLRLELVSLRSLRSAADSITREFQPVELELDQFRGEPFVRAYRRPSAARVARANSVVGAGFEAAVIALPHALVRLQDPEARVFTRFSREEVLAAAREAMPGVPRLSEDWLEVYDAYYYDQHADRPLPVLRARYDDPRETWLYLDSSHGLIALKHERLSRLNRWLYQGLHSLDFPFLYYRRPAWDLVLIVLSLGGLALSITTALPAWRRVRRLVRRSAASRSQGMV